MLRFKTQLTFSCLEMEKMRRLYGNVSSTLLAALNINSYKFLFKIIAGVPYDGVSVEVIHDNNIVLVGFLYTLAAIGILFTIACLLFNIIFRKKK